MSILRSRRSRSTLFCLELAVELEFLEVADLLVLLSTLVFSVSTFCRAACVAFFSALASLISRIVRSIVALLFRNMSAASAFASSRMARFLALILASCSS